MTTKYFAAAALQLAERWGYFEDALYAVGAKSADIEAMKFCVTDGQHVMLFRTRSRLYTLTKQALSIPYIEPSLMEAMMSDSQMQTSITRDMLIEAYSRKYAAELPAKAAMPPTTQWFRNLFAKGAPAYGQKYPRLCAVFAELHASLRTDSPSPTPAIGAENAPKPAILGSGGVERVVLALIFALFGLTANAQVQPATGKWVSLHIIHAGDLVDTIAQEITVGKWHTNCMDCDSFAVFTHIETGRKGLWKVVNGKTINNTVPVEWRGGAWWYAVPSQGQKIEVELQFRPITK